MSTILVMLGSVALPRVDATQQSRMDLAADAVANAIRFSRDEAVRTGLRHMVSFDTNTQQVQVAELASNGPAPVPLPLARHPLSRQPYVIDLDDDPGLGNVQIASLTLSYDGVGSQNSLDFTAAGVPHHQSLSNLRRMISGEVVLTLDGVSRTVNIDPVTAVVTVTGAP